MSSLRRALFQVRGTRGSWVYVAWLVCYAVFAFTADGECFRVARPTIAEFIFLFVPPAIAYVQFRAPTLVGWALIAVPTVTLAVAFAFFGSFGILYNLHDAYDIHDRAITDALLIALALVVLLLLAFGLVYYRPFRGNIWPNKSLQATAAPPSS